MFIYLQGNQTESSKPQKEQKNICSSWLTVLKLIDSAKTETKIEYLNSSKDNQQFWHRYNKLTGNKTINIVETVFRYTSKDEYTFDNAEILNIKRSSHRQKRHSNQLWWDPQAKNWKRHCWHCYDRKWTKYLFRSHWKGNHNGNSQA